MKKREFTAVYQKRGKRYIAWIEEVPGVNTQGESKHEVKENLKEALKLVLEANRVFAKRAQGRLFRETLEIGVAG